MMRHGAQKAGFVLPRETSNPVSHGIPQAPFKLPMHARTAFGGSGESLGEHQVSRVLREHA